MNAAAKILNQSNLFHGHIREIRISLGQWLQMLLFLSVLVSALIVVYCTNQYRMNLSQLEHAKQEANVLQLKWGQLLLEQASMSAPSRVQERAEDVLKMVSPNSKQTIMYHML